MQYLEAGRNLQEKLFQRLNLGEREWQRAKGERAATQLPADCLDFSKHIVGINFIKNKAVTKRTWWRTELAS